MRLERRFMKWMAFCLRPSILFGVGAMLRRARREVFGEDQPGLAFRGQVAEQTAEAKEINSTGVIRQRRGLLRQPTTPTQHMRVATQLPSARHQARKRSAT